MDVLYIYALNMTFVRKQKAKMKIIDVFNSRFLRRMHLASGSPATTNNLTTQMKALDKL